MTQGFGDYFGTYTGKYTNIKTKVNFTDGNSSASKKSVRSPKKQSKLLLSRVHFKAVKLPKQMFF